MKFWKLTILTTVLFSVIVITLVISACERNVCDNVTCFNGGSCNVGLCTCPTGYEGPQCGTLSVERFLGTYPGTTTCDVAGVQGAPVLDQVQITADPVNINFVYVAYQSMAPQILHGYVNSNVTTYSIIIADSTGTNYDKKFTLTLQNDVNLSLQTYLYDAHIAGDTVIENCTFLGTKTM